MLASGVRFGCTASTDSDGNAVVIAWVIAPGGRLLWLGVTPTED